MIGLLASALIAAAAPEPASSEVTIPADVPRIQNGRVVLGAGERAVIRFDEKMQPIIISLAKAPPEGAPDSAVAKDSVRFTFAEAGSSWNLTVDNGLAKALDYGAIMAVPGTSEYELAPTSTCTVMSGIAGLESWPHPISILLLGPFSLPSADQSSCKVRAEP